MLKSSVSPTNSPDGGHGSAAKTSIVQLQRPKAAKLKPGRKHRSPLCPLFAATSTVTHQDNQEEFFPPMTATFSGSPLIKPIRPSLVAYNITGRHFAASAVEAPSASKQTSSSPSAMSHPVKQHAFVPLPNLRVLSDTGRIQTRYAEKVAVRKKELVMIEATASAVDKIEAATPAGLGLLKVEAKTASPNTTTLGALNRGPHPLSVTGKLKNAGKISENPRAIGAMMVGGGLAANSRSGRWPAPKSSTASSEFG